MDKIVKNYIEEFKKHYRYSPTNLGKIERIENYILKLEKNIYNAKEYIEQTEIKKFIKQLKEEGVKDETIDLMIKDMYEYQMTKALKEIREKIKKTIEEMQGE